MLISENRFRANGERHWTLQFQYDQNGSPVGVSFRDCGESTFTYVYYYAKNLQGDIVGLYKRNPDGTGAQVIATYEYDPWGKVTAVRDANGNLVTYPSGSNLIAFMNPLRYRGYYQDNDTGFYYLQSRYYDPELKRFINADSYASTGQGFLGHNMFAYCGNNPTTNYDPNGTRAVMYPADMLAGGELDKSASGGSSVFGTIAENAWESICTVYKHLEIDLGVGQGLYGSLGSLGFIPLEGGFRGDYVHIKIDKGNFRFGQELKGALTGTYFSAEIGASSSTFIENGIEDPSDEWIGYNKNQKSYSIFSSSVYVLFFGYTVNISISPEGLWEEVVEIWKGTN